MALMAKLKAMTMELDSLETLFEEQLRDLYDVESQLIGALPEMAKAAHAPQLKSAFEQHLETTKRQRARLDEIFHELGQKVGGEKSEGMAGIIEEGQILANARGKPGVKDAALIAAAQHVEHYEIAGYGTARTFAQRLGHPQVASLLQQTLEEEKATDKELSSLAEASINPEAAREGHVR